ncbi:hypothetical protein [Mycobacterium vicinigordonae]|uniref:Uncharacterized protein n=1 Tax=Mycobacterium vicinigordonae TaxID=1719132 RepID=A0A7D6HVS5_9MYCO|nr:hypothetical protein [Mycobacterium vicinigordonae]QLL07993.1 hypothetical protein H0P51_03100 [Mycobacterium vicinigordonae]
MAVIVRKLFGVGKLPADLRSQVEAEGLIYLAESIPVTRRFSGAIPGLRSQGSIASYVGALAFTSQRVLATLSVVPKLAGRAVDVRWDEANSGAATAEISATGLQLDLDTEAVDERFHGHLSLHFKDTIEADVLSRLPRRSLSFDVPAEYVFRAVGVTYSP